MPVTHGPPPTPSTPEGAAAWVAHAREVRQALVDEIAAGELTVADALERADAELAVDPEAAIVAGTRLLGLLEARPGAGKVESRRLMASLGLDELITLADVPLEARAVLGTSPAEA